MSRRMVDLNALTVDVEKISNLPISKIIGLQTALDDLNTTIGNIDNILDSILGV